MATLHRGSEIGNRGPPRGRSGSPSARVVILTVAMLIIWGRLLRHWPGGQPRQDLTGATAKTVLGSSHLAGLALAFGLMVAVRRYIAPTRA